MKESFSIISLGCFRNLFDSEVLINRLIKEGYFFEENPNNAKFLVINTCGFIEKAKRESLEVIQEVVKLKRKGRVKKILVCGCLVERYKKDLEKHFKEVDEWRGVLKNGKFTLRKKRLNPFVSFLKICDGCMHNCSYCAIPLIKGKLKSRTKEEILKETEYLDKKNVKELNLIGQDITSWGKDLKIKEGLPDLIKEILIRTKIPWIRLLYLHPENITDELLNLIANERRICKYLDIPFQHINQRILNLMRRNIKTEEIKNLIKRIRRIIPSVFIRTSLIVGFPTETEAEFRELYNFVKEFKFERLGVFIYSREENTSAFEMEQIHFKTKQRRFKEIMLLQREISINLNKSFIGKNLNILVERKEKKIFYGRSEYDCFEVDNEVILKDKDLKVGSFYNAYIIDNYDYDLIGV